MAKQQQHLTPVPLHIAEEWARLKERYSPGSNTQASRARRSNLEQHADESEDPEAPSSSSPSHG